MTRFYLIPSMGFKENLRRTVHHRGHPPPRKAVAWQAEVTQGEADLQEMEPVRVVPILAVSRSRAAMICLFDARFRAYAIPSAANVASSIADVA